MAHRYASVLRHPFSGGFATMLTLKILFAFGILAHFVIAVYKMKTHTLTVGWSKYIHAAVFTQMVCIVFLAKAMFYFA